MNLYILKARDDLEENDDPWEPWYDKMFSIVVRAESYKEAREVAQENSGDENRGRFLGDMISKTTTPWLESKYSTCELLVADGEKEAIIRDVWDG